MGRKRKADSSPGAGDSFTEDEGGSPGGKRDIKCDSPAQRNNAGARERARMRVLSKGFTKLKTALPWVPPDTKLSKLDTLRLASCYIAHLRQLLVDDGPESPGNNTSLNTKPIDPLKLTWPYTFNGRVTASLDTRPGEPGKVKAELASKT